MHLTCESWQCSTLSFLIYLEEPGRVQNGGGEAQSGSAASAEAHTFADAVLLSMTGRPLSINSFRTSQFINAGKKWEWQDYKLITKALNRPYLARNRQLVLPGIRPFLWRKWREPNPSPQHVAHNIRQFRLESCKNILAGGRRPERTAKIRSADGTRWHGTWITLGWPFRSFFWSNLLPTCVVDISALPPSGLSMADWFNGMTQ